RHRRRCAHRPAHLRLRADPGLAGSGRQRPGPRRGPAPHGIAPMLPLFRTDGLGKFRLLGERTYLRPPNRRDYRQWAQLREASRAFLEPWEPSWGEDALEPIVFRDRVVRILQEWRLDLGYGFHIFRRDDDQIIGGVN